MAGWVVDQGPNMRCWGWTGGRGWHTVTVGDLSSLGAALDALRADPSFGGGRVNGEGRPVTEKGSSTLWRDPHRGKHHLSHDEQETLCGRLVLGFWESEGQRKWAPEDGCKTCAKGSDQS
jgi:hypothetical protein